MKTAANEMAPHFRKAVLEIDSDIAGLQQDIARLQITRGTIVELYGGESEIPAVQTPERPAAAKTKKPKTGGASGSVAPGAGVGRAPSADYVKLMASVRTAPEPFTAASLGVNTGIETKFCANKLFAWQQRGWLEKAGRGEFKRTATFPNEAPAE